MEPREGKRSKLLDLLMFGTLFSLLFVAFAATTGFGSPQIPSGVVAVVEGVPTPEGTVTKSELRQALAEQVAISGGKIPRFGSAEYIKLEQSALSGLLTTIWLAGQAEELGLPVQETGGKLDLGKLQTEIERKLTEQAPDPANPQPYFSEIDFKFPGEWLPRTHCGSGYIVEQCSGYVAGHLSSPCYEAHPREKIEGCPAPVPLRYSAQPGTYTTRQPAGEILPQGPLPAGE